VLGLAFHPDYLSNRRLFRLLPDLNEDPVLIEFKAEASFNNADRSRADHPAVGHARPCHHFGGTVNFGPDGYLYVATGDGRPGKPDDSSQDSMSLLGKMLRLDARWRRALRIPRITRSPDAWTGAARSFTSDSNPYRWSFDRQTGDTWIGDVGEDNREEVDFLRVSDRA
jgi:hypothetical protein